MRAGLTTLTRQPVSSKYHADLLHTGRRFHYDMYSMLWGRLLDRQS
jgi:hypothetical protein